MHNAIYTTDPATGDRVMLSELARRHGIHVSTLSRRYADGRRGADLLSKPEPGRHQLEQHQRAREDAERKQSILSTSSAALMRPFSHIAGGGKMVGGGL
ncbi:hypothetical protein [Vreelandella profundi]|uniref:hypothetical protein n=1 Tax=Vreelandella profundi TaxID=2852117 RepID=UPI001F165EA8|nr:hypothetical protein [Halomonas profundi]